MNDVKVDFTYCDGNDVSDYTCDLLMGLLSVCGDMGLYMYTAQVNL